MLVAKSAGYAVVVQGKIASGEGLNDHRWTTDTIVSQLKSRSFIDKNITHLTSNESSAPSKAAIRQAILDAGKEMNKSPAPLYIIMVDHGNPSKFYVGGESADNIITPDELNNWLSEMESSLTGDATKEQRIIVIGTCYSGSFISQLSKQGRVIITSASESEESIRGPKIPLSGGGYVRSGEYFLDEFFTYLTRGLSVQNAFTQASKAIRVKDPRQVPPGVHSGVYDTLAQHALLDDNGDRAGTYDLFQNSNDGPLAASLYMGEGAVRTNATDNPADIRQTTPTTFLQSFENGTIIWLEANQDSRVGTAWFEIRKPDTGITSESGPGTGQVIIDMETVPLTRNSTSGRWETSYNGFTTPGTYEIFYYTRDSLNNEVAPMARSVVYRNKDGNSAPGAFNLSTPANGSTEKTLVTFTWEVAGDSDPLNYTLEIAADKEFNNVVFKQEEIKDNFTVVQDGNLHDTTSYFWRVIAVDTYGNRRLSSQASGFSTYNTNSLPGIIKGYIRDSVTGQPLSGASITTSSNINATAQANGAYILSSSAGSVTVTANKGGYSAKSTTLSVISGKSTQGDLFLKADAVQQYNITATSAGNGTITCTPSTVTSGASVTCKMATESGYYLSALSDNGSNALGQVSGTNYTVSNVGTSHTIVATFSLIPVNGACGSDNGTTLAITPTNLCSSGSASTVTGSGPWSWSCQGLYGGTGQNCSASLTQQAQTITFTPPATQTYGDAAITLTATGGSSGNPVTFTLVGGPATLTGNTLTITGVGTIVIKASQAGNSNYTAATDVTANIVVGKAALTITAAAKSKTYGASDPALTYTTTGLASSDTMTGSLTRTAGEAVGSHSITQGSVTVSAPGNYNISYTGADLTIGKATPAVTWSTPADITYGTALSGTQLNATSGGVAGTFTYTPPSGTVLSAGSAQQLSVTFTPSDSTSYNTPAATTIAINVSTKALTITAKNISRAYGDVNPATPGFSAPALVGSDSIGSVSYTYASTATATAAVGSSHAITPSNAVFTSGTASNYNITYTAGTLTIAVGASQSITFNPPTTATYGDPAITLSGTATSGLPVTFTLVSGPATLTGNTLTITGPGTITVRATQGGDSTYSAASDVQKTITVTNASYTVTGSTGGNGSIQCVTPVTSANTTTCTLTPDTGYRIAAASGCGTGSLSGTVYTTGTISASCTVSASFTVQKAGDCDNNGTVTIAEVQSAINMFLGLKTVEVCVDLDSSSSVSIAEVQKVINSFLGL